MYINWKGNLFGGGGGGKFNICTIKKCKKQI